MENMINHQNNALTGTMELYSFFFPLMQISLQQQFGLFAREITVE